MKPGIAATMTLGFLCLLCGTPCLVEAQNISDAERLFMPRSELWWLKQFWSHQHEAKASKSTICFVGDSLVEYWPKSGQKSWEQALSGWSKLNLGIAADRVEHVSFRCRGTSFNSKAVRCFVVLAGTNNLSGETVEEPEAVIGRIKDLLSLLRGKAPDAVVILMGLPPNGDNPSSGLNQAVRSLNQLLMSHAKTANIHFLDTASLVAEKDGAWKSGFANDGTHFNEKGYDAIAEELKKVFTKMAIPKK